MYLLCQPEVGGAEAKSMWEGATPDRDGGELTEPVRHRPGKDPQNQEMIKPKRNPQFLQRTNARPTLSLSTYLT